MGLFSAIGSALSGLAGGISKAFSAVFPPLGIANAIFSVVKVLFAIAKNLGMPEGEQKPEELGDRAIQGAEQGITREGCKSHNDYMNQLKGVDLKAELTKKSTKEEKEMAAGMVAISGLEEKLGVKLGEQASFLPLIAKKSDYFTPERTQKIFEVVGNAGMSLDKVAEFFDSKGTLDLSESKEIKKSLVDVEQSLNPELSNSDAYGVIEENTEH